MTQKKTNFSVSPVVERTKTRVMQKYVKNFVYEAKLKNGSPVSRVIIKSGLLLMSQNMHGFCRAVIEIGENDESLRVNLIAGIYNYELKLAT